MLAHHHFDRHRIIRMLILIWTLLLLLVLLPTRAHGQEEQQAPASVEILEESSMPPQFRALLIAEAAFLAVAAGSYSIARLRLRNKSVGQPVR